MLEKIKKEIKGLSFSSKIKSVVFLISLIAIIVLLVISNKELSKLYDQQAALRWDSNGNSYQMTLLFDEAAKVSNDTVMELLHNYSKDLNATLGENAAGFINFENEDASYTDYAYMSEGNISLSFESRSVGNVKTYGIAGDYFLFHPYEMINGSFFDANEINKDCIVLDENSAYALFGSSDVVGMTVYAGNVPLIVSGVYKPFDTKYDSAAKGFETFVNTVVNENGSKNEGAMECLVYIPYDTLCALAGTEKSISCVEIVSIAPSESFMYNKLSELTQSYISSMELVKNTSRFGIENMFNVFNMGAKRSMRINRINYPYFENVARAYEDVNANYFKYIFIFSVIDLFLLISYIHHAYVNRKFHFSILIDKCQRIAEKARETKKNQKQKWEHF